MKEISIIVKYDENEFKYELRANGFDDNKGPINILEIVGAIDKVKKQELDKLD